MLNKEVLESIFEKLLSQAKKSYDEFNVADGKIGDGDLGVTILNGLEEVNNNKANFKDDMGSNFMVCSQAFVKKSGSSFGTLIAFSFMNYPLSSLISMFLLLNALFKVLIDKALKSLHITTV